jgi:hypothetical protein
MQAGITAAAQSTGSKTIADLIGLAAERYGDQVAARRKVDGAWEQGLRALRRPRRRVRRPGASARSATGTPPP